MSNDTQPDAPAPDDLEAWKKLDTSLSQRCATAQWFKKVMTTDRAIRRYLGHTRLDDMIDHYDRQGLLPSYAAWGILDYRPTASSKTRAQAVLEADLPAAQAALLKARMEAAPGLLRIVSVDTTAGTVGMESIFDNGVLTVHDRLLSTCVQPGLFLVGRIFQAGNFWFYEQAGPPLSAVQGTAAAEFLRQQGMDFTPEGRRRDAHMFGRLWQWVDDLSRQPMPMLANMDGDPLLWHTVSFSVSDPAAACRALDAHPDIEKDDEDHTYRWMERTGPATEKMNGPVVLGKLEFVGDELILEVNSERRLARAKAWLETTVGAKLIGVKTRSLHELQSAGPADERLAKEEPIEMTPSLVSAVDQFMKKQYMGWLDTSIPALGGKTPRQAVRTPAGRQQVLMMIRTIPDPAGPANVKAPREMLLRELGLEGEAISSPVQPSSHVPRRSVAPDLNIGRNEPCPCGSGRKYKNCCAR